MRYGLVPTSWGANGVVTSVKCRFCDVFKREERKPTSTNAKPRKKTENVKYFKTFRPTCYKQHLELEHPAKWAAFDLLRTTEEKEAFFGSSLVVPVSQSLHAHFDISQDALVVHVKSSIVDTIIGDLLFHPDSIGEVTHSRALSLFHRTLGSDGGVVEYTATITNQKRFYLLVGLVERGTSFRMAADIAQFVRDETGLSVYTGSTDTMVSNSVRVLCAASLQFISLALDAVTGFSIALDTSTLHGKSYLDIRARFTIKGVLYNFHLMAVPLYEEHTGERMFETMSTFLDALRLLLVGVSTDGESSIPGRIRGVATRLEVAVPAKKLVRVWCPLHQLDLVMQRLHKASLGEEFLSTLTSMTRHLRRQPLLVAQMGSTCPLVADTRWLSMEGFCSWIVDNIVVLQEYYATKLPRPSCIPSISWWIFVFAVQVLTAEANLVFVKLQGKLTLHSQQCAALASLVMTYARLTGMEGPLSADALKSVDESRSEIVRASF